MQICKWSCKIDKFFYLPKTSKFSNNKRAFDAAIKPPPQSLFMAESPWRQRAKFFLSSLVFPSLKYTPPRVFNVLNLNLEKQD